MMMCATQISMGQARDSRAGGRAGLTRRARDLIGPREEEPRPNPAQPILRSVLNRS